MSDKTAGFRFRLTFHHASPGLFRFEDQSVPVELGEGLNLTLTARDANTLLKATRFHIEGRGFTNEEAARLAGERLRLRLRVLNSLLGLGIVVPTVDLRRATLGEAVKKKIHEESGSVIIDTIEGLAVVSDDQKHFEHVSASTGNVFPSDPAYVLTALAVVWPMEMQFDERADDALQILGVAISELSPRAKFLTTYLALERMIDRLPRSEAAQKLIEEFQQQVRKSVLGSGDKDSLVSSLGNLKEQSFRTALFGLATRFKPEPIIDGLPCREFLSKCVDTRNSIAHNATLDASIDLAQVTTGLRQFVMSLIWAFNRIPDVSVNIPPSTVQIESFEIRIL